MINAYSASDCYPIKLGQDAKIQRVYADPAEDFWIKLENILKNMGLRIGNWKLVKPQSKMFLMVCTNIWY